MIKPILFASLLAVTACSKKDNKNEAPPIGAKPSTDPGTPPGATPAGTTAATPKLNCDRVLSKGLRDKHLKDAKFENIEQPIDSSGGCKVTPSGDAAMTTEVTATCHANMAAAKGPTLAELPKSFPDMKPIAGIPDSLAQDTDAGWQFTAYDNDSNCSIIGILPKGVDGPAFVKDWLAELPPK